MLQRRCYQNEVWRKLYIFQGKTWPVELIVGYRFKDGRLLESLERGSCGLYDVLGLCFLYLFLEKREEKKADGSKVIFWSVRWW